MNKLKRILYIDDDPIFNELAVCALGVRVGLSIQTCCSPEAALILVNDFKPDLIVTDQHMYGYDVFSMLSSIQRSDSGEKIPTVLITADSRQLEHSFLTACGIIEVIYKPCDYDRLSVQLENLWRSALRGRFTAGSSGQYGVRTRPDNREEPARRSI